MLTKLIGENISFYKLHFYLYTMGWKSLDNEIPKDIIFKDKYVNFYNTKNDETAAIYFEPITQNDICITGIKYYEW